MLEVKNYKPTSHLERLFDGKIWVKKSDVERILKQLGRTSSSEDEDVCVKLWICLLFTTFLIPDSNCGFPSWLLCYIDDLDMIPSYNWALNIFEVLMDSLENLKSYCLGCAWALLVRLITMLTSNYNFYLNTKFNTWHCKTKLIQIVGVGLWERQLNRANQSQSHSIVQEICKDNNGDTNKACLQEKTSWYRGIKICNSSNIYILINLKK